MSKARRLVFVLLGSCLATACDLDASPDYLGESLFGLHGKVTIEDNHTQGKLVPALAFDNAERRRLDILDVHVRGEFPNNFSVDVFNPPPKATLVEAPPGEAHFVLGYVTAVSAEHAAFVPYVVSANQGGCDDEYCYLKVENCTEDKTKCYRETSRCDLMFQNCVITDMSGDDPGEAFAGLSENYRVLYLDDAVAAESKLSKRFAGGAELEAGYHLIAVRRRTQAEMDADDACLGRATREPASEFKQAVSEFNAARGTHVNINDQGVIECDDCDDEAIKAIAFGEVETERIKALRCSALEASSRSCCGMSA